MGEGRGSESGTVVTHRRQQKMCRSKRNICWLLIAVVTILLRSAIVAGDFDGGKTARKPVHGLSLTSYIFANVVGPTVASIIYIYIYSFIHSFIHYMNLYSVSSRLLLKSASTAKKE